jgi:Rap1a immunity proteins
LMVIVVALCATQAVVLSAGAEIPNSSFVSGNDVYDWCQHEPTMALAYTAGQFDGAVHAAYTIESMRDPSGPDKESKNGVLVDMSIERVIGFCMPQHATTQQITDIFCKYLKDTPAERDGLPAIILNKALTKAWPPCH